MRDTCRMSPPRTAPRSARSSNATPDPTATMVPAASAPITMGSFRLANAMPRQPHTSIWLSATAPMATVTSPRTRRRCVRQIDDGEVAVIGELERTHQADPHPPRFAWSPPPPERGGISGVRRGILQSLPGTGRGDRPKAGGWGATPASHAGSAVSTRQAFCPPNPNEFDSTADVRARRATFGTTSNGIAGSG